MVLFIYLCFSHVEIAGHCLRGEFPWDFWHVFCHHLDKTHTDVKFRCHSYTICRLESLYIFVPTMNFFFFLLFLILSLSLSDKIFFNGCRKYKICSRSADLFATEGSFNFEVWVSTWEWEGLFVLLGLCAWVTIKRSLTENYSICLIFVLFSPFFSNLFFAP